MFKGARKKQFIQFSYFARENGLNTMEATTLINRLTLHHQNFYFCVVIDLLSTYLPVIRVKQIIHFDAGLAWRHFYPPSTTTSTRGCLLARVSTLKRFHLLYFVEFFLFVLTWQNRYSKWDIATSFPLYVLFALWYTVWYIELINRIKTA